MDSGLGLAKCNILSSESLCMLTITCVMQYECLKIHESHSPSVALTVDARS